MMFPKSITVNVTQEDLDNGGRRGERPDAIHTAANRAHPGFRIVQDWVDGEAGLGLVEDGRMGWYRATPEYVTLINAIDLTNGKPKPIKFDMPLTAEKPWDTRK